MPQFLLFLADWSCGWLGKAGYGEVWKVLMGSEGSGRAWELEAGRLILRHVRWLTGWVAAGGRGDVGLWFSIEVKVGFISNYPCNCTTIEGPYMQLPFHLRTAL